MRHKCMEELRGVYYKIFLRGGYDFIQWSLSQGSEGPLNHHVALRLKLKYFFTSSIQNTLL